jgi:hypothetical protein
MNRNIVVFLALAALPPMQAPSNVSIRGRVVDDIDHQAVSRVGVTAQCTEQGGQRKGVSAGTDAEGNFTLSVPGSGRCFLQIGSSGFLSLQEEIAITNAGVDLGDIVVTRGRTISGTIRSTGGPLRDVRLQALEVKGGGLFAEPDGGHSTYSGPNGEFSLGALRPGRYVVFAPLLDLVGRAPPAKGAPPVFFPGGKVPDISAAINLRDRREVSGISIAVEDKPGVSVSGTVLPSAAYPAGTPFAVALMVPNLDTVLPNFGAAVQVSNAGANGRFELTGVPQGSYSMWVLPVGGNSLSLPGIKPPLIDVGSTPVTNLQIPSPAPVAPITGKAEFEDANGRSPAARIMAVINRYGSRSRFPLTDDVGDFTLNGSDGEPVTLSLETPRDSYVAVVVQDGRDLSRGAYALTAGGGPVSILIRRDAGSIQGRVTDGNRPGRQAFVVLAPQDRNAVARYKTTTAGPLTGSFQFGEIAPGDYDLFALDRNDEDQYVRETYLRKFAERSVAISVRPRSASTTQLQVIPTR